MSAPSLMLDLHRAGFVLSVDDDKLNVDGPLDRLTDTLRDAIREHKAKLIAYCTPSSTHGISRRMAKMGLGMDERLNIIEFDGNLPRQQAERVALAVLKGRKPEILAMLAVPEVREKCLHAARERGYPRVTIRPGESVMPGAAAWERFASNATIADVRQVLSDIDWLGLQPSMIQP